MSKVVYSWSFAPTTWGSLFLLPTIYWTRFEAVHFMTAGIVWGYWALQLTIRGEISEPSP